MATGDFVVASVDASTPGTLRIADVICGRVRRRRALRRWTWQALAQWPGAQVAVAEAREGGRVLAVRGPCSPVIIGIRGQCPVVLCAAVGYAWIASGWPLTALAGLRLRVPADTGEWGELPGAGTFLTYALSYEHDGASAGPLVSVSVSEAASSAASSRRTWSASGAPVSSNRASAPLR